MGGPGVEACRWLLRRGRALVLLLAGPGAASAGAPRQKLEADKVKRAKREDAAEE